MPEWRNGRRTRLKIWRPYGCMGSNPISGTIPTERPYRRRGARAADWARLESVCAPKEHRGFESLPLRHSPPARQDTESAASPVPPTRDAALFHIPPYINTKKQRHSVTVSRCHPLVPPLQSVVFSLRGTAAPPSPRPPRYRIRSVRVRRCPSVSVRVRPCGCSHRVSGGVWLSRPIRQLPIVPPRRRHAASAPQSSNSAIPQSSPPPPQKKQQQPPMLPCGTRYHVHPPQIPISPPLHLIGTPKNDVKASRSHGVIP